MQQEPKFMAMAEVLSELGAEIEALGEILCRDGNFVVLHMRELQAFDLIAQKQHALAAILAGGFSATEMRQISLDALRRRFSGFTGDEAQSAGEGALAVVCSDGLGLWD